MQRRTKTILKHATPWKKSGAKDKLIEKWCLGQIVSKAELGTNCLKNGAWDKLFEKRCLGQIAQTAAPGTNCLKSGAWDTLFTFAMICACFRCTTAVSNVQRQCCVATLATTKVIVAICTSGTTYASCAMQSFFDPLGL